MTRRQQQNKYQYIIVREGGRMIIEHDTLRRAGRATQKEIKKLAYNDIKTYNNKNVFVIQSILGFG